MSVFKPVDLLIEQYRKGQDVVLLREEKDALLAEVIRLREDVAGLQRELGRILKPPRGGGAQRFTVVTDESLL